MTHINGRLLSRVLPDHRTIAQRLVNSAAQYSNAALVTSVDPVLRNDWALSNGDHLVVIVRDHYPVTIMYSWYGQLTSEHLRVSQIVRL